VGTRAPPQDWSIGEVAEHVAIVNRRILRRLSTLLAAEPLAGRSLGVIDEEIPYLFYRGDEPPNVAAPTGAWTRGRRRKPPSATTPRRSPAGRTRPASTCAPTASAHPIFGLMDGGSGCFSPRRTPNATAPS